MLFIWLTGAQQDKRSHYFPIAKSKNEVTCFVMEFCLVINKITGLQTIKNKLPMLFLYQMSDKREADTFCTKQNCLPQ